MHFGDTRELREVHGAGAACPPTGPRSCAEIPFFREVPKTSILASPSAPDLTAPGSTFS